MRDANPFGSLGRGWSRRVAGDPKPKPKVLTDVEAWNEAVEQRKAEKVAARLLKARLK